jgi:hypothetical protein
MDSRELPAGYTEIARRARSGCDADCIELRTQLVGGYILANVDASPELDSLRFELRKAELQHRFLELEIGYSVAKEAADAFVLFEYHSRVSEAPELLRSS